MYIKSQYIYPAVTINGQDRRGLLGTDYCGQREGYRPANSLGLLITLHKMTWPPSAAWCVITCEMSLRLFFILCVYPSRFYQYYVRLHQTDQLRPLQRAYGIVPIAGWGSRVGEEHRFRLTEKLGKRNGRETWVEKSPRWRFPPWRNKNSPPLMRCTSKEGHLVCEKRAEADGRRGASRSDQRRLTASSGPPLDLVSIVLFEASFKLWFVAVQTLWFYFGVITSEADSFLDWVAVVNSGQSEIGSIMQAVSGLSCLSLQHAETFGFWPQVLDLNFLSQCTPKCSRRVSGVQCACL